MKMADTVGAGDSSLASLIAKLLSDQNPDEALNFASAVGALVTSYSGANPKIESSEIDGNRMLFDLIINL